MSHALTTIITSTVPYGIFNEHFKVQVGDCVSYQDADKPNNGIIHIAGTTNGLTYKYKRKKTLTRNNLRVVLRLPRITGVSTNIIMCLIHTEGTTGGLTENIQV